MREMTREEWEVCVAFCEGLNTEKHIRKVLAEHLDKNKFNIEEIDLRDQKVIDVISQGHKKLLFHPMKISLYFHE